MVGTDTEHHAETFGAMGPSTSRFVMGPVVSGVLGFGVSAGALMFAEWVAGRDLLGTGAFIQWAGFAAVTSFYYLDGFGGHVPHESVGVTELFGKRIKNPKFWFSEGNPWVPRGFLKFTNVHCGLGTTDMQTLEVLSKEGIKMRLLVSVERLVDNPYRFLSAQEPFEALRQIILSKVRDVFSSRTGKELLAEGVKGEIRALIKEAIDQNDYHYGLNVTNVFEPEILPPQEVLDALAKVMKEVAEAEAEEVELVHVRARIKEILGDGVEANLAYEIVQSERGKITTNRNIMRFEGLAGPVEMLAGAMVKAFGKQPVKGRASGGRTNINPRAGRRRRRTAQKGAN